MGGFGLKLILASGLVFLCAIWTDWLYSAPVQSSHMSQDGERSREEVVADGVVISFNTLTRGFYSGVRQPLKVVARTQDQWADLWRQHTSIKSHPPPLPHVDFATEMVVGVFLGEGRTGGYEVEITKIEQHKLELRLYYREISPPPDAVVTQALTQPYHLVKLPKHALDPVFLRVGP